MSGEISEVDFFAVKQLIVWPFYLFTMHCLYYICILRLDNKNIYLEQTKTNYLDISECGYT